MEQCPTITVTDLTLAQSKVPFFLSYHLSLAFLPAGYWDVINTLFKLRTEGAFCRVLYGRSIYRVILK